MSPHKNISEYFANYLEKGWSGQFKRIQVESVDLNTGFNSKVWDDMSNNLNITSRVRNDASGRFLD